ncbi:MAG: CHAD domain-containing protein [Thermoleophilaceae bacterium]
MKAKKVKGLDPDAELADAMCSIVKVRARELRSFAPRALDPAEAEALHDMRIAAKRLRYVFELAQPCFGDAARARAKRARALQDAIGAVHDCDVLLPLAEPEPALAAAVRARRKQLFGAFLDTWGTMEEEEWEIAR